MMTLELNGLRAVITGGTAGIGLATAALMAERGAYVAVLDLEPETVPEPLMAFMGDVTDELSVLAGVADAAITMGGIDILVNNVGDAATCAVLNNPDDQWRKIVAMVDCLHAALPHLRESEHAAIVNVGSIVTGAGQPRHALQASATRAIQAVTVAMAADYGRDGIRVNCVNLGAVDTPSVSTAQEGAEAIAYLAGPLSEPVTATAFAVDGSGSTRLPDRRLQIKHLPVTSASMRPPACPRAGWGTAAFT